MKYIFIILLASLITGCNQSDKQEGTATVNPPAKGFNKEASDEKAIAIADSVMKAMGGRKNYDSLRYIAWNFFGMRNLVWDKQTGRVRIDATGENTTYLLNIHTMEGKVMKDSVEITHPDSLQAYLEQGRNIWINDSYWLVMPFKLKDTGVTLKYAREDTTNEGIPSHVLSLTFDKVGVTPENKYEVYVDKSDYLVRQWAYFKDASQTEPSAVWPWDNYVFYHGVLLSSDRSDGKGPRNVRVYESLPDEVFNNFDRPKIL